MKRLVLTGVGSRRIDAEGTRRVEHIAKIFNFLGFTLRSGAADGADSLFELNMLKKEIYLPHRGFKGSSSNLYKSNHSRETYELLRKVHPFFVTMRPSFQELHLRNAYQVLGADLDLPSDILVCWTPDGASTYEECEVGITGGTLTAIRIACLYNVPAFNLKKDSHYNYLVDWFRNYINSLGNFEIPNQVKELL